MERFAHWSVSFGASLHRFAKQGIYATKTPQRAGPKACQLLASWGCQAIEAGWSPCSFPFLTVRAQGLGLQCWSLVTIWPRNHLQTKPVDKLSLPQCCVVAGRNGIIAAALELRNRHAPATRT